MTEEHNKTLAMPQHSATNVDSVQTYQRGTRKYDNKRKPQADTHGFSCISNCYNCGGSHAAKRDNCPANGQQCHTCKKWNHFKKCCKSIQQTYNKKGPRRIVHQLEPDQADTTTDETFYVDGVTLQVSVDATDAQIEKK